MATSDRIQSLEELYLYLQPDESDLLRRTLNDEEWEYNFDALIDDMNGTHSDLSEVISQQLSTKIKSVINGGITLNPLQIHQNDQIEYKNEIEEKTIGKESENDSQLIKLKNLILQK